jgi:hypothetical protein
VSINAGGSAAAVEVTANSVVTSPRLPRGPSCRLREIGLHPRSQIEVATSTGARNDDELAPWTKRGAWMPSHFGVRGRAPVKPAARRADCAWVIEAMDSGRRERPRLGLGLGTRDDEIDDPDGGSGCARRRRGVHPSAVKTYARK